MELQKAKKTQLYNIVFVGSTEKENNFFHFSCAFYGKNTKIYVQCNFKIELLLTTLQFYEFC